jgi:hypothetical protein
MARLTNVVARHRGQQVQPAGVRAAAGTVVGTIGRGGRSVKHWKPGAPARDDRRAETLRAYSTAGEHEPAIIFSWAAATTPLSARQAAVAATIEIFSVLIQVPLRCPARLRSTPVVSAGRHALREYAWLPRGALCDRAHPARPGTRQPTTGPIRRQLGQDQRASSFDFRMERRYVPLGCLTKTLPRRRSSAARST